jgi:hypothetical protein
VLQRVGRALPRHFLYTHDLKEKKGSSSWQKCKTVHKQDITDSPDASSVKGIRQYKPDIMRMERNCTEQTQ